MTWTVSDSREIVGTAATFEQARRGCLNDMGRPLFIHDGMGRVRARFLDGRDLDTDLTSQDTTTPAVGTGEGFTAAAGTCGICSREFAFRYPPEQYSTVSASGLPVCDDCDEILAA